MYLLLTTQGITYDVESKWDEWQLRVTKDPRLADLLQFYLKATKGLKAWRDKHGWIDRGAQPVSNSAGLVLKFADMYCDYDYDKKEELVGAGYAGLANAYLSFADSRGAWISYVHLSVRHAIFAELRRFKRWQRETTFSEIEDTWKNGKNSFKTEEGAGVGRGDDDLSFVERYDTSMWQEPAPTNEEQYLAKEVDHEVNVLIADVIPDLTERERYVFWNNIHTESPVSVRDIADQFRVGKSSVHRDRRRILKLLKETSNA